MSISGALANALSGLNAASRSASVVSDNLANAMTDGFGRREISLSAKANGAGGGVEITSIDRIMNRTLVTDRRMSAAEMAGAETRSGFLSRVQDLQGEPGSGSGLTDLLSAVESALVSAASRPDQEARQTQVVDALKHLIDRIDQVSNGIQTERSAADAQIDSAVTQLNADLAQVAELNIDIRKASMRGESANALMDVRQQIVDRISEFVPVRELDRGNGMIALMTEGGMLLDGKAPVIDFQPTPIITEHHSYGGGQLSGLTVNGKAIDISRSQHLLSGGTLEAHIHVRDSSGVQAQEQLDGFARDLIERFSGTTAYPGHAVGTAGLLTDAGAAFSAANETGLAGRLALNAAVDPDQGGQVWRLRDGLSATTQGPVGDATGLENLVAALSETLVPGSAALSGASRTAAGQAADLYSATATARASADTVQAYAQARHSGLTEALLADGVDSDSEMQKLLLIEQAYAANARVVSAAQTMLDVLMEI